MMFRKQCICSSFPAMSTGRHEITNIKPLQGMRSLKSRNRYYRQECFRNARKESNPLQAIRLRREIEKSDEIFIPSGIDFWQEPFPECHPSSIRSVNV
jgi:hypothetical protein